MKTAHGFYCDISRMAYPEYIATYWREQASRGMTTVTISANDAYHFDKDPVTGLAMMIEGVLDAGLARMGEPLLVLSCSGEHAMLSSEQRREEWPELVLCGVEDPSSHHLPGLRGQVNEAHEYGFRLACCANAVAMMDSWEGVRLGSVPDVWIVQGKTWQKDTSRYAHEMGKELWSYWCDDLTGDPRVLRYYAGVWAWAHQVRNCLVWAYSHDRQTYIDGHGFRQADDDRHTFAPSDGQGNIHSTEDYNGFEQGVHDCRLLERAYDADHLHIYDYLNGLRAQVMPQMFRRIKGDPPIDMDGMAAHIASLLE